MYISYAISDNDVLVNGVRMSSSRYRPRKLFLLLDALSRRWRVLVSLGFFSMLLGLDTRRYSMVLHTLWYVLRT